jgi:hypothetical protein
MLNVLRKSVWAFTRSGHEHGKHSATLRSVAVTALVGLFASGCAGSNFASSYKSSTAQPLNFKGAKVAAVVMMGDEVSRKSAEAELASQISARGGQGVPMYEIAPGANLADEAAVKETLEKAGVKGVVVMRPTADSQTGKVIDYSKPPYSNYWGEGFYAHGWGQPWIDPMGQTVDTVVTVDTLVYSLAQNQLVWAGKSRKTNPATLNELVKELSGDTAEELKKQELIK